MHLLSPSGFEEEIVVLSILKQALFGLEYFHQSGQIHRDIKASNFVVDAHGTVKLSDFGVSAVLLDSGDRRKNRQTFVGTPCWMAPEVLQQVCFTASPFLV